MHMYAVDVKAVTITVPDELDARAADEARRRGISKSALYRLGLEAVMGAAPDTGPNSWIGLAGFGSPAVVVEPGDIDREVYGP